MADNLIRNIVQTHTEPTIIKMAPDVVVYIDGLPYLKNDWISGDGVIVNFNDYVTSCSGSADVGTFIPSLSLSLSVPYDMSYQFMAPGGNRIIPTMSEIKVFAKGYYHADGESVYQRVFWGVVTNVSYNDDHKMVEVSISAQGILHLLDLMQINVAPSAITALTTVPGVTWAIDKDTAMNPFGIIFRSLMEPLNDNLMDATSNVNASDKIRTGLENMGADAFSNIYADKWNSHLKNIVKGFRMMGLPDVFANKPPVKQMSGSGDGNPANETSNQATVKAMSTSDFREAVAPICKSIDNYTPNFVIGTIPLMQSTIINRLTKLQEMVDLIGWEGYQDIDGSIVIKPPLYNLDVLKTKCTDRERNPFIVNLDEVIGREVEVEDSTQVRFTRTVVHGHMSTLLQGNDTEYVPHAIYFDPIMVRQFGLRMEGTKDIPFIFDPNMLYAYAAEQMVRANRKWRTYTVTIPMRPEIRVGFPIYVPHKDFYAYVENISWTYAKGSSSTMTLTCSSIRNRELFQGSKTVKVDGKDTVQFFYRSVPNLILRWAESPKTELKASGSNPTGTPATKPAPATMKQPSPQEMQILANDLLRKQTIMHTEPDTLTHSWRIMDDDATGPAVYAKDGKGLPTGDRLNQGGFFRKTSSVDSNYYYTITHYAMPYTDEGGYVLQRPFPWGRHMELEEAIDTCLRPESRRTSRLLPFEGRTRGNYVDSLSQAGKINAFLLAGLGSPQTDGSDKTKANPGATAIQTMFNNIQTAIADDTTMFLLRFTDDTDVAPLQKRQEIQSWVPAPDAPKPQTGTNSNVAQETIAAQVASNVTPQVPVW